MSYVLRDYQQKASDGRFFLQQQGEENKRHYGVTHRVGKEPYHSGYSRKA